MTTEQAPTPHRLRLHAEHLHLAYDGREVVSDLDVEIRPGAITVIVGANACGKSTLLRGMARLLKPRGGEVLLDGKAIQARWRCPPDSSSTGRSARSRRRVASRAPLTAASSSVDHCCSHPWCG